MLPLATLRRSKHLCAVCEANAITEDEIYESANVIEVNLEAAHSDASGYNPHTLKEALSRPDAQNWINAMVEEIDKLVGHKS